MIPAGRVSAQGNSETIASSGEAPQNGNGVFNSFFDPSINESGQVGFRSQLNFTQPFTANGGIFRGSGGIITQLAREGDTTPDGNGAYEFFNAANFDNLGRATFLAEINAGGDQGIFLGDGGNISQLVRNGEVVPDSNGTFSLLRQIESNGSGQVTFMADLAGTAGATSDDSGIFRGGVGNITQIVREGQLAPDASGTFSTFVDSKLNNSGQIAFLANLVTGNTNDNQGLFLGSGGSLTQIARKGDAPPDGNGVFANLSVIGLSSLNESGQIAFNASVSNSGSSHDNGIFLGNSAGIMRIARERQAAPDGNGFFMRLRAPSLNEVGQVAFTADLVGTNGGGDDNHGIFRGDGATINRIASEGQSAPDNNGVFSVFDSAFSHASLLLNNAGQVAFSATLKNTVGGGTDDTGLFTGDGIDILQVAREGDSFAGSTISSISFRPDSSAINSHGQIAYRIELANGGRAVRRWTPDLRWRSSADGMWGDATNWSLGLNPAQVHDVFIDPDTSLTVSGTTTDTTVRDLHIGGGIGNPVLAWKPGVELTAESINVHSGTLTGGGTFNANTILVATEGNIVTDSESMVFNTATITNHGYIEFREDSMRVNGNLDNAGQMNFLSNASLLVNGDFNNQGNLNLFVSDVSVQGTYSGDGDVTGRTGILDLEGTLAPGNSTASILIAGELNLFDDSISEFELGGINIGEFDQIQGMDMFNIDGDLIVSLINGFELTGAMEFIIADVNGSALGQFNGLGEGDLVGSFGGQNLFISYAAGNGNDVALFTAVPEPANAMMCGLWLAAIAFRRRRPSQNTRAT